MIIIQLTTILFTWLFYSVLHFRSNLLISSTLHFLRISSLLIQSLRVFPLILLICSSHIKTYVLCLNNDRSYFSCLNYSEKYKNCIYSAFYLCITVQTAYYFVGFLCLISNLFPCLCSRILWFNIPNPFSTCFSISISLLSCFLSKSSTVDLSYSKT